MASVCIIMHARLFQWRLFSNIGRILHNPSYSHPLKILARASKTNLGNLSNVSFVFSNFCHKCKHAKVGQSMMLGFKVKVAIKYVLIQFSFLII